MEIEFYNVKKKNKVKISIDLVSKVKYESLSKDGKKTRIRYALKAVDKDGVKLTKFCSKTDFDSISD